MDEAESKSSKEVEPEKQIEKKSEAKPKKKYKSRLKDKPADKKTQSDSKKEIPSCDELLAKYKERQKKSKIASKRAKERKPTTVGDIIKKVSEKAVVKLEKAKGKTTRSDRAKILVSFKNILEEMTPEDRKEFIAEIKPLVRKK